MLKALFFPVPYPQLLLVHFVYGGIAGALITMQPSYAAGLIGGGIGVLAGLIAWVVLRKQNRI